MHQARIATRYHILLTALLLLSGCNAEHRFANEPPDFRRFGELPGLEKSADPALQDEFARLQAEEATPAQLAQLEPPLSRDAAKTFRETFPTARVESLLEDFAKVYPEGKFVFSGPAKQRARDLLKNHHDFITAAQATFAGEHYRLPIDHNQGLLADMNIVDVAEIAHRADALAVIDLLDEGDLTLAHDAVIRMLRLDHALASARHVVPRMKGARLRLEALRVLEAVVQDERVTPAMLAELRDLLADHLRDWPEDADAWIGDRGQGLHTYEMIRHGLVLSVFSDAEIEELREETGVGATAKAVSENVDADERYYLQAMREIIDACDQPYHQRRELLEKIARHLQDERNAPDFPLIAGRILLVGFDAGHRQQAQDRAACEGWLLALCHATNQQPPDLTHNPQTGRAYQVQREETRVVVTNARAGEPDEAIIVPILP